ncbi:MAG: AMP-binding protein [Candidatus Fimivivens sp.]|nr:AMP-binding protein [Candidatus Fimivivens sp.]
MFCFNKIEQFSSKIALINENNKTVSYAELIRDADAISEKIGGRCLVFLMCHNCIESVAGYIGFLRNKIVPVMINEQIDADLLSNLLESYHPAYFFLPESKAIEIDGTKIYSYGEYTLVKLNYDIDYALADELALLLTTSGSTGSPKLVRQSYKNIEANTDSIIKYLNIGSDDNAITTLPMSYTYGLSIINSHLCAGASIILNEFTLMDKKFWALLKTHKATTFGGVPYTYEMLKKLRFGRMDLPTLRYITQAGGKLSKELSSEFSEICEKKGIEFIVMYGQTEATARMSYLPWEYAKTKAGSMGIAIPGGSFWLSDTDGNRIEEPDVTGELMYCGDNVTLGYAQSRHDLCRPDENCGTLRTGDMAKRDADGFYYIVGRKKRFLKLFGNRVNLDEVEGLLKQQGYECACAGVDDCLKIYITDANYADGVMRFITEHTAINRAGVKIVFINQIPRNESGKVLYSALEAE